MNTPVKLVVSTVFACGFAALVSGPASAMPLATSGVAAAPQTEQAHVVRVCNRWGRCWMTARHFHGPRYGYGWRPYHRHYGYGWRRGYRHW
ncbi:hypothetical protein [Methylocystis echinoides]|uniref:Uncharacterized protein n=1 Tax=Methylocystis echinoides TaxID=29468 RepID=A0A9W6GPI9_9HYPH|nr:hypothetical protein [Methylocystis echinoides]GLI91048.1 hypothetical protein LMG27198_00400 [Methylocystis echinoides]